MSTTNRCRAIGRIVFALTVLGSAFAAGSQLSGVRAAGVAYQSGDVFVGIGGGQVAHYSPTGVLLDTLNTTSGSREDTGMCFDKAGFLYTTNFDAGTASKFDNQGNLLASSWGGPFSTHPESCVLDNAGNVYVGEVDGTNQIHKYDAAGAVLATYNPGNQSRGIDWMDLAADQCTMYYTSEGSSIKRFNVCTDTQLPDFATGLPSPCYALRIRSNGEVIVTCATEAIRLDAQGNQLMAYPITTAGGLFAMNLDPDGTSFWTAGYTSGTIYRIDIASGATLTTFTASHGFSVAGLAVFGEHTVGCPTCVPTSTPTPISSPATASPTPTDTAPPTQPAATPTEPEDTATASPSSSLSVSPRSAVPFQTLTITGTHFGAGEPVVLWWDTTKSRPLGFATTTIGGSFVTRASVPQTVRGRHIVLALGTESLHLGAAALTIQPLVLLKPATGAAGSRATAQGFGFGGAEAVTLRWATPSGPMLGTTSSNAVGSFTAASGITFTVPMSTTGTYPVFGIGQTSHAVGVTPFMIG